MSGISKDLLQGDFIRDHDYDCLHTKDLLVKLSLKNNDASLLRVGRATGSAVLLLKTMCGVKQKGYS